MKNILIHGLGQNNHSWNKSKEYLKENDIDVICPNLFDIKDSCLNYQSVYEAFVNDCNYQSEKLNLCGLSLGGILALDYAKEYPEKVNSLILIGTPFQIPKKLFKLQSIIFKIMPKSKFEDMGCSKSDFINLVNSMGNLDIKKGLDKLNCKCLILCGNKDNVNMKSAKKLEEKIKKSEFIIVQNASHEVNVDNPKELANLIAGFWKEEL